MSDRFLLRVSPSMLSGFSLSNSCCVRCSASSSLRCTSLAEQTGSRKCYLPAQFCRFEPGRRSLTCSLGLTHQAVGLPHCDVGLSHHRRRVLQLQPESLQPQQRPLQPGASLFSLELSQPGGTCSRRSVSMTPPSPSSSSNHHAEPSSADSPGGSCCSSLIG